MVLKDGLNDWLTLMIAALRNNLILLYRYIRNSFYTEVKKICFISPIYEFYMPNESQKKNILPKLQIGNLEFYMI